ncbi:hypothetical protein IG631_18554 [Alternaria alternata]|nr:hypothetical protein IG631_18554 [Alternaria alternata]
MSTSKLVADLQPNVHQVESILQRHQSHLRQSKHCRRTVERSGIVACIIELLLLIVAGFVAKPLEIITMESSAWHRSCQRTYHSICAIPVLAYLLTFQEIARQMQSSLIDKISGNTIRIVLRSP